MYLKLIAGVILAIILAGSHWKAYKAGEQNVRYEYLKDYTENLQAARDKEQSLQFQLKKAQDGHVQRQNILLADASRVRRDNDRLRDELREMDGLSSDALRRYSNALGIVFSECVTEYSTLAEDAGRSQSALQTMIEAWPQ